MRTRKKMASIGENTQDFKYLWLANVIKQNEHKHKKHVKRKL